MIEVAGSQRSHILTVVLQDYFQVGAFRRLIPHDYWNRFDARLRHNTEAALGLLAETGNRATFFASGWIADNHPGVLREIVDAGHEVACQGYHHNTIWDFSRDGFIEDALRSRDAVSEATGRQVYGYRIGRGWLGRDDTWALEALAEAGFSYDSSVCQDNASPAADLRSAHSPLQEVPVTGLDVLGWTLPIGGGNYMRQLPEWLVRAAIRRWQATHDEPMALYFHSWELDPDQPRITAASPLQQIRQYRNLPQMTDRVRHYLQDYRFTSIAEHLDLDLAAVPDTAGMRAVVRLPRRPQARIAAIAGRPATQAVPLTVVVPCYNEHESLPYLRRTLDDFIRHSIGIFDVHVVLVDDGSEDRTWERLQKLFAGSANCRVLRHRRNSGIAAALLTGFREARTDLVAVLDADCSFAPDQLIEMYGLLADDVDVVAAAPDFSKGAMPNVPFWRTLMSRGCAALYRAVLHHSLPNYTSCFRLYRRRVLQDLELWHSGFCGITEILGRLDLAGHRIVGYPAVLEVRLLGHSKIKVLATIMDHLRLVGRLALLRWLGRSLPAGTAPALQQDRAELSPAALAANVRGNSREC